MENLQPNLRRAAEEQLRQLAPADREALLIKCWMSHDARWFVAVVQEFGMEVANRLNQIAAREAGKAEARRMMRALKWQKPATARDYLRAQETLIALLGPDLLEYTIATHAPDTFEIRVTRCFAYDNVRGVGMADAYDCGIFARVGGWLDAFGISYEISPPLAGCLMAQGRACTHVFCLAPSSRRG